MRSQARSSGIKLPEVHGMRKNLDPNVKPEKQHAIPKQGSAEKPHTGQGRDGLRRKRPDSINQSIKQPLDLSQKIPRRTEIETRKTNPVHSRDLTHSINNMKGNITNNNPLIPHVPFHPGPVYRPPPKPIRHDMSTQGSKSSPGIKDNNPNINFDFKENSPFQEGVISEKFQTTDKSFFQEPKELEVLIDRGNLVQKCLPKQTDIDKILKVIQRKVLKGTHLLVNIKEINAGYLHSSNFKDTFLYLSQNKLPPSKAAIKKVKAFSESYILLDSLLFKITPEKETAVLEIPETCVDRIIVLYHSSLFTGHQGVIKTCLTVTNFLSPTLYITLGLTLKDVIYAN